MSPRGHFRRQFRHLGQLRSSGPKPDLADVPRTVGLLAQVCRFGGSQLRAVIPAREQVSHNGPRVVRARLKIGLQNLAYNMRRLMTLDRMAAA